MAKLFISNIANKTSSVIHKVFKWAIGLAVVIVIALIIMLIRSSGNTNGLSRQFDILLLINGVLAVALILWVFFLGVRLVKQIKRKEFGAKITTRFALVIVTMTLIPGLLIYLLSVQYMSRTVESWFNVKVDTALESGISLGQASLDGLLADLNTRASLMADQLNKTSDADMALALTRLREANPIISDSLVFTTSSGTRVVGFSSSAYGSLLPQLPDASIINGLRVSRHYAHAEPVSVDSTGSSSVIRLRVIVPIFNNQYRIANVSTVGSSDPYWLQITRYVPDSIAENLNEVQKGFSNYQELSLSRSSLRELFLITLTMVLLLTFFLSVLVAVALARRMVKPLLTLAEGTQAVAVGDYSPLPEPKTKDEITQLTRSFNLMTQQLEEARHEVQTKRLEIEASNVFMESVLRSMSSGVLVFDKDFCVTSVNLGAEKILHQDLSGVVSKSLQVYPNLVELDQAIRSAFSRHEVVQSSRDYWQEQIELNLESSQKMTEPLDTHKISTLLMRGTRIMLEDQFKGYLVVFDDISEVISASRSMAWGEVARRLAHEIKNPLTPIQLSAERLAMKLEDKLDEKDASMLMRSTNTIVNQVASLKKMVDDFREYARTPPAQLQVVNLNELIVDLGLLYGWDPEHKPTQEPLSKQLALDLDETLPLIDADPMQLRQVFNNLLSNSRDAMDGLELSGNEPGICIHTKYIHAQDSTQSTQGAVLITVEDRGCGFSSKILTNAFEPYVTTKAHGTGLGLAIVHKIVEEHGGKIEISNKETGGARISILFTRLAKLGRNE